MIHETPLHCFSLIYLTCGLLICEGELFANTAGGDFTPHVVTVNTGEVMY